MTTRGRQKTALDQLRELEEWMRLRGVIHVRLPDGLELRLGSVPPPPATAPSRRQSPEDREAARIQREQAIRYAATSMRPRTLGDQLGEMHAKNQRTKTMRK